MSFDDALRIAQERGYAEKTVRRRRWADTARKICILASIVSGRSVRLRDCRAIEGIRGILPEHTEAAALLGYSLKLLGVYENGETYTAPCLVPFESLLSATEDVFNAVSIIGTAVGEVVLYGRGAGALPTASAIVSDVIEAINGTCPPVFRAESDEPDAKAAPARRFVYVDVIPDAVPRGRHAHERRRLRLYRRRRCRHERLELSAGLLRIPRARPAGRARKRVNHKICFIIRNRG